MTKIWAKASPGERAKKRKRQSSPQKGRGTHCPITPSGTPECRGWLSPQGKTRLEAERADEGTARVTPVPNLSETLARERCIQRVSRHCVRHLGEGRIINLLVAAQVVARAQAAGANTSQVARHQLDTAVHTAHLQRNGSRIQPDHIFHPGAGHRL